MDLLQEIAHCPNVEWCMTHPDSGHPCAAIVKSQQTKSVAEQQLPEPWIGHLEQARLLFLGSNPSISFGPEEGVHWSWSEERIARSFSNLFDGQWVRDGRYILLKDGSYSKAVPFWSSIRRRAAELLNVDVKTLKPGIDYCISNVVHCKSLCATGVSAAFDTCVSRYLERVVSQSGARIVVSLGVHATRAVRQTFAVPSDVKVSCPIVVGQQERRFTFLPHPAARSLPKTFANNLTPDEFERLRVFVRRDKDE